LLQFVEEEYIHEYKEFTTVLATFLHMHKNDIISTFDLKSVVTIILSNIDNLQ